MKARIKDNNSIFRAARPSSSVVFYVDNENKKLNSHNYYMLQTEQRALKNKSNRGKIVNLVCFLLSIVVLAITLIIQQKSFGVNDISKLSINTKYLWYTLLAFAGIMLCDSMRTHILVFRSTRKHRPFVSYKSTAICRYYDCITPFSFGGQPFQIYYLSTRGIKGGIASSVPLAKYIYSQVAFCIVSTVLLVMGIARGLFDKANTGTITTFSIVSLSICSLFLIIVFFMSLNKKFTPKLVWFLINLGSKAKLVKNREVAFTRSMRSILEYQRSILYYIKSVVVTLSNLMLSVGMILLKGLVPYLVYLMFVPEPTISFVTILILYNVCELVTMFIPLPGGSGVAELSFTALFAAMFPETAIFWAMIFFRIFTYYIYIIQGFAVNLYDIIIGNHINERLKNKSAQ